MTLVFNYDKIKGLIYTEKSNRQLADVKYHFQVDKSCNKKEIASLVKKSFKVDVEAVNVSVVKPKRKIFKGIKGLTSSYKKAIVTLKKGQSINLGS